jgi:predicted Zn-dependent peptidase
MYRKTVLDNGLRIISESINHVRSISIGIWVKCGSRYEEKSTNGTAHFIEHMLFKGTKSRSAFNIAYEIDSIGGLVNAYTGKEATTFYMKIPDYHLSTALEILADIFNHSLFEPDEIEKEKEVVLQEIHMVEDTPDEYIYDYFGSLFWGNHALGFPILGTKESVSAFERENLLDFFNSNYRPEKVVIAATGNLEHEELVKLVAHLFESLESRPSKGLILRPTASFQCGVLEKELEQIHAIVGSLGPSYTSPDRHACFLLNAILGGSMSSRLFQEIREKRGLAYSIHSYLVSYQDIGKVGIYVGTGEEKFKQVLDLIMAELLHLRTECITDQELHAAKEQIKGNFLLGMESTDNRMTRIAKNEIYFEREVSIEETLGNIDSVKAEGILDLSKRLFGLDSIAIAALGRVPKNTMAGLQVGSAG